MGIGERVRRSRNEVALPGGTAGREFDSAVRAVLEMQRSAGNRAVGRLLSRALTVTAVDWKPMAGSGEDSTVDARALKAQITQTRAAALWNLLQGVEKQRLDQLGRQNLQGPDVPSLAVAIIGFLAGNDRVRIRKISVQQSVLEEAIGAVATTPASGAEKGHFREVQGMASHMSRAKGTPNTVPWANVPPGDLRNFVIHLTTKLRQRNQYLAAGNYAAHDGATTSMQRASYRFAQIRSPHLNRAGWLPTHAVVDPEPALDTAAQAWWTRISTTGTVAEQAELNLHVPVGVGITSQQVEDSGCSQALRQNYLSNEFANTASTPAARISLNWARYTAGSFPGCPYIEFTAEDAGGVSRFVYDYVNNRLYANTHYNWVDGFSPFFEITGGPAMR